MRAIDLVDVVLTLVAGQILHPVGARAENRCCGSGARQQAAQQRNGRPVPNALLRRAQLPARLDGFSAVFENVIEMRNTVIEDEDGALRPILEIIPSRLSPRYAGVDRNSNPIDL